MKLFKRFFLDILPPIIYRYNIKKKLIALIIFILAVMGVIAIIHPPNSNDTLYGGTAAANVTTSYKNNLTLNWAQTNRIPSLESYITPTTGNVYIASDITYCTTGDSSLKLDLYANKPLGSSDSLRPIVIYIHGGGMIAGDKTQLDSDVSLVMRSLIEKGFVVAAIDYGIAPKYKFPSQIQDVLCAVRFMKYYSYSFSGNQNKIGLFGDSVGGQLSALAGVTNGTEAWENPDSIHLAGANLTNTEYSNIPTRVQAVVDYYGSAQLPESPIALFVMRFIPYHDPFSGRDYTMHDLMQMIYNADPTLLHEASSMNYITRDEPPFLIAQGDKDRLNQPSLSTDLYKKLRSLDNPATLIMVQNADHRFEPNPPGSTINPNLDSIVNSTTSFFEANLK